MATHVSERPICETPGCGREIPPGGEGHPEICPTCLQKEAQERKGAVKRSAYHRDLQLTEEDKARGYVTIDMYLLMDLFEVSDHAVGHAIKKLFCPGARGAKTKQQDIEEAVWSLQRYLEIQNRRF